MIKILLAEDHNIVRNGIKMLLETEDDILIVGEASNGKVALEELKSGKHVDVILTDINMPELDGISLISEVRALNKDMRVIVLSMHDHEKYVSAAFSAGADGYILKNVGAQELIFAIKHVYGGGKYLCAELGIKLIDHFNPNQSDRNEQHADIDFSIREMEVLNLIAEGLTNSEIAEKLFVSKRTVEGHRQNLLEKTNSKNTAMLIRYAVLNGMVG